MKEVERRTFGSAVSLETRDDDSVTIKGHAAVFDKLSENLGGFREKIAPGAFDDVLGDDIRALYNHNPDFVLGRTTSKTLRVGVDEDGLTYEVDLPDTNAGRDLAESMRRGDVNQSSFGFSVASDEWAEVEGEDIRTITKVSRLYDVSPVTYPAYPDAKVGLRSLADWKAAHEEEIEGGGGEQLPDPVIEILREKLKLAEIS